uniref:Signal recognition particle SRP54 subunit M-domain domain-containing protein n=2 Tax=Pseudo-nitzschia australis TaxID=44445 RepID=A0A6U9W9Z5_9STRA|mmetsp:Transcript_26529/g.58107  ORF Transcript_26529/g.58107 Transcript_26529/m.58107 type:complete len:277 (-) Transcript_26529:195-1025(-)|eukprot:CAMPEP_0168169930 /NCGR_PEP_ID=MMETSP0139_2-20121125/3900_1 /TAXON_ID=44445 /ORGANISM="Pseudo-nitzschia australis, Strain 10249 10 AB" /LENGTH=276 /DNA_ID=CAMNT_0008087381 /DNA_START=61 /DNA_END=891 /DNA_ORIENTATION=-
MGRSGAIIRLASFSSVGIGRPFSSLTPRRQLQPFFPTANTQQWRFRSDDFSRSRNLQSFHTCDSSNRSLNPRQNYSHVSTVSFSSTASSTDGKKEGAIRGWMNDRQARQEKEKYMEQMTRLSTMEVFTMEKYRDELQMGVDGGGIMTKISFMQTKEIKQAKEVVEVVEKIIEVVGPDATAEDLIQMDRLQRLRVATEANKTLEEISIMVSQITNMDVMQKTLRKRHLEGRPIPPDKETMQSVIQKDALSVLSKAQKEMMKSRQENNARRMARKRRR